MSLQHPDNTGVLRHLGEGGGAGTRLPASLSPQDALDPYMGLGTHPDVVERLWDEITVHLPEACRWVVYGRPALVHPRTGIVFGFAGGSHTYAMRLPPHERARAIEAGAKLAHTYADGSRLDLAAIGAEWVLGGWLREEPDWCLAAYAHAGRL